TNNSTFEPDESVSRSKLASLLSDPVSAAGETRKDHAGVTIPYCEEDSTMHARSKSLTCSPRNIGKNDRPRDGGRAVAVGSPLSPQKSRIEAGMSAGCTNA